MDASQKLKFSLVGRKQKQHQASGDAFHSRKNGFEGKIQKKQNKTNLLATYISIVFFRGLPWRETTTEMRLNSFKSDLAIRKGLKDAERPMPLKRRRADVQLHDDGEDCTRLAKTVQLE